MGIKRHNSRGNGFQIPFYLPARFAMPTAVVMVGAKGEKILAGGIPAMTGIAGGPNNNKTLLALFISGHFTNAVNASEESWLEIYDSESTLLSDRVEDVFKNFTWLPKDAFDPFNPLITLTSNSTYHGDEWLNYFKLLALEKKKTTCKWTFLKDKDGKPVVDTIPTMGLIDTLSKYLPKVVFDKIEKAEKAGTDTNMIYMESGLDKSKMFVMLPRLLATTNTRLIITAHVGDDKHIGASKFTRPEKKLTYFSADKKMRGVPQEFFEAPQVVYHVRNSRKFINQTSKMPFFPRKGSEVETDLHIGKLEVIRNKLGPSGTSFSLVTSQKDGVMAELTDLVYLRENQDYGISGNPRSYYLDILPDVKMSNGTFMEKLDNEKFLARALEITADLKQFRKEKPHLTDGLHMEPKELYQKIIDLGYKWEDLLDTRSMITMDMYNKNLKPYMSTIDLLEFANEIKKPYWM